MERTQCVPDVMFRQDPMKSLSSEGGHSWIGPREQPRPGQTGTLIPTGASA